MKIRLAAVMLLACIAASAAPPQKILFIGNSLTYFQNGIYFHLENLTASARPPITIQTEKSVFGGATLKSLWERAEPRDIIGKGGFDVVVLQEDIPEIDVASFHEYARRFVGEIRRTKARPVLLMAWAYRRLGW